MQLYPSQSVIFHSPNSIFFWGGVSWSFRTLEHNHRSCLFIMRPGSEIIFLPVFHSHRRYLFRREKNLELYIVILLYRKKNGFINILPTLVTIAHRDNHKRVTGCVPLLGQNLPNIWGDPDHLAARRWRSSGLTSTTPCILGRPSPMSVLSWEGGEKDFLPW